MNDDLTISEWSDSNLRWSDLMGFFDEHKDGYSDVVQGYDQRDSRVLVATINNGIVGMLRLIVILIGPGNNLRR